jgi:hypothetical protein
MIFHILGMSCDTQIGPTIVERIMIDMVNLTSGPFPSHIKPSKDMSFVLTIVDPNAPS